MKKELTIKDKLSMMKDNFRWDMGGQKMEGSYRKGISEIGFIIFGGLHFIKRDVIGAFLCRVFGHKIISYGHATPETGCDEFECTRCGWYHRHVYY